MTTTAATLAQAFHTAQKLHQAGQWQQAGTLYQKILQVIPDHAEALHGLGLLYYQSGQPKQAVPLMARAVQLQPGNSLFHHNVATVLAALHHYEPAVQAFQKALEIKPDYASAIINMCTCLHELGRWQEEVAWFEKGIARLPDDGALLNEALKAFADACYFHKRKEYTSRLIAMTERALVSRTPLPVTPYHSLTLDIPALLKKRIAERYAKDKFGAIQPAFTHAPRGRGKIRIGYVSADFRNHPTAHLIRGLFEHHNRTRFKIFAYSYGPDDQSSHRKAIEQHVDHFVDMENQGAGQMAQRIHADNIDILVDVMGYIQNGKPELFALRPAPVQISYLAYPGTMGAPFIDYLVTDGIATPTGSEAYFTERLLFMPDSYFITDPEQPIATPPTRAECGLQDEGFVFCSFNKSSKINACTLDAWAKILAQVPDSMLWLFSENDYTEENLRQELGQRGIPKERLAFAHRLPKDQHLARHLHADLFLDCLGVCAHTTAIDALYAGVPLITLAGEDMITRASASMLHAAGLGDLVTHNEKDYCALAVSYALDRSRFTALKQRMPAVKNSALFDVKRYVQQWETLLVF